MCISPHIWEAPCPPQVRPRPSGSRAVVCCPGAAPLRCGAPGNLTLPAQNAALPPSLQSRAGQMGSGGAAGNSFVRECVWWSRESQHFCFFAYCGSFHGQPRSAQCRRQEGCEADNPSTNNLPVFLSSGGAVRGARRRRAAWGQGGSGGPCRAISLGCRTLSAGAGVAGAVSDKGGWAPPSSSVWEGEEGTGKVSGTSQWAEYSTPFDLGGSCFGEAE